MINEYYDVVYVTNNLAYFTFLEDDKQGYFQLSPKNLTRILALNERQERERQDFLATIYQDART